MSTAFAPSVVGTMSDLDGYSVQGDFGYPSLHPQSFPLPHPTDDFGFDPAPLQHSFVKTEQTYSPPEDSQLGDFTFDPASKNEQAYTTTRALELDHIVAQNTPNTATAISRFGQVTPPRSNSESSVDKPEHKSPKQRRGTKPSLKEELQPSAPATRKRRNTRKSSIASVGVPEEDNKRKQSLEKNRLAAAKCRVNKKEKTEKLQRDSHDKAIQNAFLKEQVMRMKEEVQQMNALLLAHANSEHCKSPGDIQEHLSNLGNEFFAQHIQGLAHHDFPNFADMSFEDRDMESDEYYSPTTNASFGNPPLPDFNRETDFDVTTPMHTD